ncbi:hypothetical protein GCM10027022_10890 [Alpinimonas psychrophila]|uniref:Uncharacterized protein n=1 Tax=Alpinimonas psychrophila TaxID=748908 RepID=A0A7W3PNY9_9MICO|nr:hypothetical protein [Alpinimonas psychrophila]MBA8828915.1 hypothetical protein [Alpinimonas psychrophila]
MPDMSEADGSSMLAVVVAGCYGVQYAGQQVGGGTSLSDSSVFAAGIQHVLDVPFGHALAVNRRFF